MSLTYAALKRYRIGTVRSGSHESTQRGTRLGRSAGGHDLDDDFSLLGVRLVRRVAWHESR